jgi:hypothetical protein
LTRYFKKTATVFVVTSIFHYTDAAGLSGILSSHTMFATDYRFLNDANEVSVIRDLVPPVFEAEIADIAPKLIEKKLIKGFTNFTALAAIVCRLRDFISRCCGLCTMFPPYLFCRFANIEGSDEFKHGLLSQRRGYGERGGYAIEFSAEEFPRLL